MTEPETLALLEVKGSEALEKSPPQALVPNGRQPEGEGEAETHGAASSKVGSSAGSTTAGEGPEDGLDSTVSEAATLPWGTGPPPSALFPDPPGWRDMEPEPLRSEPPTKLEDLSEDDANLLPEKAARAFVPIDLQCIERRPQEDPAVRCEAGEGEGRRACLPARPSQPEPCERKWAEAVVRPPGHTCGGCGGCGGRDGLRAVASVGAALLLFPCLLYGAYAFLPFDAPRLPTMSSRLIYTLRCGVFATFPIILGEPAGSRAGGGSSPSPGSAPPPRPPHREPSPASRPRAPGPTVGALRPARAAGVRAEPAVLLGPAAVRGAAAGGGDPPALRGPVGAALHLVLLQPGRALHLPAPGDPQTAPPAHRSLCRLPVSWLAGWGWGRRWCWRDPDIWSGETGAGSPWDCALARMCPLHQ